MKRRLFYSVIGSISLILLFSYFTFFWIVSDLPHIPNDLRQLVYAQPTEIFADDGTLVHKLGGQSYVPLEEISPHLLQAVVAAEDKHFHQHYGFDKLAFLRALYINLFYGKTIGGSTITQQLAKNLFFSFQKHVMRKAKELLIAFQLESMFSKNQILEAYCNLIYFGGTAYGIEDAAQQFFNKSAASLSLAESALLAGIINSPHSSNPLSHPEKARRRQHIVLEQMRALGMIDDLAFQQAERDSLRYTRRRYRSNDFIDYVLQLAEQRYGREAVYYGGLKIYTTLDVDLQRTAEEELEIGLQRLETELDSTGMPLQGAMAVISVPTGEVKALVGAREHLPGGFNRAISENRHVGSGIKPFIYYGALERLGLAPYSVVVDTPVTFHLDGGKTWRPRNFERAHRGKLILKSALMQSVNVIAAKLGEQLTPKGMVEIMRRFGIEAPLPEVLPLSLGTAGISPLEMAAAYATFVRNGVYFRPVLIKRVENLNGTVLDRAFVFGENRLDPQKSYQVLDMMKGVVEQGTGRSVRLSGFLAPAAGKTGTSTSYTDAWFTGVTTSLATSVWVGYDRIYQLYRKSGQGVTGGYAAGPIWANFMKRATQRYPARPFSMPEGLRTVYVDPVHGWEVMSPAEGLSVVVEDSALMPLPTLESLRRRRTRLDTLENLQIQQ